MKKKKPEESIDSSLRKISVQELRSKKKEKAKRKERSSETRN